MQKATIQPGIPAREDVCHRLRVLLISEGNYPYHWGGVSTWCQILISELKEVDFIQYSIIDDADQPLKFKLPENVVEFHGKPLWGMHRVLETRKKLTVDDLIRIKRRTTDEVIETEFIPPFQAYLANLFTGKETAAMQAQLLNCLHHFFLEYDYDTAMSSPATWRCFLETVQRFGPQALEKRGYPRETISLAEATKAIQWLYHWLIPLAQPIPKVDVAHAAMAGICTLVAVMAKLEHGAAFLLTEHGVYLRERYFFEAEKSSSLFLKYFSLSFSLRMTELSYALADQITPCCNFNKRWELRNGVDPDRLQTIYYGVDSSKFSSSRRPPNDPLVVVWMGRIDPLKDLSTLLHAAALVHQQRPEIQFRLFGSAPLGNEAYNEQCLALWRELGLEGTVTFSGFRSDTNNAYNEGDIFVLTSKSEAFPFVNLEAMLCERPVVSSAVGGVPEQLEGCGFAVEPCNPQAMADAILKLAADPELRATFGRDGRNKVITEYNIERFSNKYAEAYQKVFELAKSNVKVAANDPCPEVWVEPMPAFVLDPAQRTPMKCERALAGIPVTGDNVGCDQPIYVTEKAVPPQENRRKRKKKSKRKSALKSKNISILADEVIERDPKPIDALEVTALLEAQGLTDQVARQRYGYPNMFELGEAVLFKLRKSTIPRKPPPKPNNSDEESSTKWADYARGPLSLLPVFLVLLIIAALTTFTGWDYSMAIAISIGMTGSMIVNNGLLQSVGRRLSIYQGTRNEKMARLFLIRSTICFIGVDFVAAALFSTILFLTRVFGPQQFASCFIAFVGMAWLWLLGGELAILGKAWWLGLSMATGFLIGMIAGWLANLFGSRVTFFFGPYWIWGCGIGYLAALGMLVFAFSRVYTGPQAKAPAGVKLRLPPLVFLLNEASPYFLYGSLYMIFILIPHLLGLTGKLPAGIERLTASTQFELVFTLAMFPMAIVSGVNERTLRKFWKLVPKTLASSPMSPVTEFQNRLSEYIQLNQKKYLIWLIVISLEIDGICFFLLREPVMINWLQFTEPWEIVILFQTALIAFGLVGLGIYNAMYCLTLGCASSIVSSVVYGALVTLVIGIPASAFDYHYSAAAFLIGAAVLFVHSRIQLQHVLEKSSYHIALSI